MPVVDDAHPSLASSICFPKSSCLVGVTAFRDVVLPISKSVTIEQARILIDSSPIRGTSDAERWIRDTVSDSCAYRR